MIAGRVWKFGDNINTDLMLPGPLLLATDREQLRTFGVAEPMQDRLDSALVRAIAGSGADLLITPNAHSYLDGGLGATLRFPMTPASAE